MSPAPLVPEQFRSEAELAAVVQAFEACTVSPAEFNHRAHLTVALWYLTRYPEPAATAHMRRGLQRFLAHHGVPGYNETITLFWLKLVRHFHAAAPPQQPLPAVANALLAQCADARLLYVHYSRERVQTAAAKAGWVEPDLRRLDF